MRWITDDYWEGKALIEIERNTYRARIVYQLAEADDEADDTEVYHLVWTDFVANDWHERYGTLALAIMRLAALDDCVEADGTFTDNETDFAAKAALFLEGTSA